MQRGIITLIKSAVLQQPLELPEGFDLEQAYTQIRRHSVVALCYDGAVRCGVDKNLPVMQKLFHGYLRSLQVSEGQMRQVDRICKAFEENGIDYMPLKGCNMKKLYPAPELRTMGDADILIRVEQYERIKPIMEGLGFRFEKESDHELVWVHPELFLELHKRVMTSYNVDFFAFFGDGWQFAKPYNSSCYVMQNEDAYLYTFVHFSKHYRGGGIGLRHVVDLWLYHKKFQNMDMSYLQKVLKELNLLEFHGNVQHLIDTWFENGGSNEITEFMTDFIFASGNWGEAESKFLSSLLRKGRAGAWQTNRLGYVISRMFPSADSLSPKYTVLQKAPWLLPVVWIYRPFYKLIFERKSLKKQIDKTALVTEEKIDEKRRMLRSVGLDFNF